MCTSLLCSFYFALLNCCLDSACFRFLLVPLLDLFVRLTPGFDPCLPLTSCICNKKSPHSTCFVSGFCIWAQSLFLTVSCTNLGSLEYSLFKKCVPVNFEGKSMKILSEVSGRVKTAFFRTKEGISCWKILFVFPLSSETASCIKWGEFTYQ